MEEGEEVGLELNVNVGRKYKFGRRDDMIAPLLPLKQMLLEILRMAMGCLVKNYRGTNKCD